MKNIIKIAALLLAIAVGYGCSENPTSTPEQKIGKLSDYKMPNYEDMFDEYKYADLTGIIRLQSVNHNTNDIFYENGYYDVVPSKFHSMNLNAIFYNKNYDALDINLFEINSRKINKVNKGHYEEQNEETSFNFDFDNSISLRSSNHFAIFDLRFLLKEEANIVNLEKNDSISKPEGYILNWNGGRADSKAKIEIHYTTTGEPNVDRENKITNISWELENSGSVDLKPYLNQLDYFGTYNLKLTIYEPHTIGIANDGKILIVGESSHEITFDLTN